MFALSKMRLCLGWIWIQVVTFSLQQMTLYCLMAPGLSKDIQCHVQSYYILCLQITKFQDQATSKQSNQPGDYTWPF